MADTRELRNLIGAYLHQDWREEYESWEEAVADFAREDVAWVAAASAQLSTLLRDNDELGLKIQLDTLGSYYDPTRAEGSYRAWLTAMHDRLIASLAQRRQEGD
jgi:hypothetical protein